MTFDLGTLQTSVATYGKVARVVVAKTAGSAPREAGTSMLVWEMGQSGTIGGGALEFTATNRARDLDVGQKVLETIPLGPSVGQCCGGSVTLVTEVFDEKTLPARGPFARQVGPGAHECPAPDGTFQFQGGWLIEQETKPKREIWIYGAGHVGRAVIAILAPLPDLKIVWVDTAQDRFPTDTASNVDRLVSADPAHATKFAPSHAEHVILTYSHDMDLALCHALLSQPTKDIGLIGSATKWAKFQRRLRHLGHTGTDIARITCPIGDPSLGKHPQEIAIGVAMGMLNGGIGTGQKDRNATDAAQA